MPEIPSRIREAAISVLIVVVLAVGVFWCLPQSAIKKTVAPALEPIGLSLGLDQNWTLFAPAPPERQEIVEVYVTMADGTVRVWTLPKRNPIFGVPYTHRWRKFKESLLTQPQIRSDFAHWVVRESTPAGDRAVYVAVMLRTEDLLPPGLQGQGQTGTETLYTEDLTGHR